MSEKRRRRRSGKAKPEEEQQGSRFKKLNVEYKSPYREGELTLLWLSIVRITTANGTSYTNVLVRARDRATAQYRIEHWNWQGRSECLSCEVIHLEEFTRAATLRLARDPEAEEDPAPKTRRKRRRR